MQTTKIQRFQLIDTYHWLFEKEVVSRNEFSQQINLDRKTIYRWERQILTNEKIWEEYRRTLYQKQGLDRYQRFIILALYIQKFSKEVKPADKTLGNLQSYIYRLIKKEAGTRQNFFAIFQAHK